MRCCSTTCKSAAGRSRITWGAISQLQRHAAKRKRDLELGRQASFVVGQPDPHRSSPGGNPEGKTGCGHSARECDRFAAGDADLDRVVAGLEIAGQAVAPSHLQRRGAQVIHERELIEWIRWSYPVAIHPHLAVPGRVGNDDVGMLVYLPPLLQATLK